MKKPSRDWSLVDWSKTTTELGAELEMDIRNVSRLRRRYAPQTIDKSNKNKIKYHIDWPKVDWTTQNKVLAELLNVPKETVNQMRRKHAPETIQKRAPYKTRNSFF